MSQKTCPTSIHVNRMPLCICLPPPRTGIWKLGFIPGLSPASSLPEILMWKYENRNAQNAPEISVINSRNIDRLLNWREWGDVRPNRVSFFKVRSSQHYFSPSPPSPRQKKPKNQTQSQNQKYRKEKPLIYTAAVKDSGCGCRVLKPVSITELCNICISLLIRLHLSF